ncbi:MAG: TIGR02996 domain-containing protein [Planctomycetes bacterium]|nr:TIGR02996 domain-containing protein [Planctomycetota bacterium]
MSEEAGFVAALLAEPTDRTTQLVYADWLDDRGDPRAGYLRRLATGCDWPPRSEDVDLGWVMLLRSLPFGPGCRVKWDAEPPEGLFDFATLTADRRGAAVRLTIRRRSRGLDFGWWELEVGK